MKSVFFILEGNNGATYIFNAKDMDAVTTSLKFYKARTAKQKVMKNALKLYLNGTGLFCKTPVFCALKNKNETEQYLEQQTGKHIDFELDDNCSILVSPTRDKIIVHHHDQYFHKFAFGKSYENVKNEAKIYELLDRSLHHFVVSKLYDHEDRENEICSFKLSSQRMSSKIDIDLTAALVELFNVSRKETCQFSSYLEGLKSRYAESRIVNNTIEKVLEQLARKHKNTPFRLGLVHRDFKPWNINEEQGLLIYDFEEAVIDGLPLEDLFNYLVDPIVRYVPPSVVVEKVFNTENVKEYERYLDKLQIALEFEVLFYCYVVERAVFWMGADQKETSDKYRALLEYLVTENGAK